MNAQSILVLAAILFVSLLFRALWKRREALLFRLGRIFLLEVTYLGVAFILIWVKQPPLVALLGGVVAALILGYRLPSERSRYIRASVRRRAIARYELKTGKKFNPQKVEVDHKIPFSKGGSHTLDNLQVLDRKLNRSKAATSPWCDLLSRR